MNLSLLIWGNLKRRKVRTGLTFLSVVFAFVLFGFLTAMKHALAGGLELHGDERLIVRHRLSISQLIPQAYQRRIARVPGVTHVMHQTWFGGYYQDPKNAFNQNAVVPDDFFAVHPEYVLSAEAKAQWKKIKTGAIVGRRTADRFHWKVGDKIPIQSTIWGTRVWEFDLVGIFDGVDQHVDTTPMFFRYDYFEDGRGGAFGQIGWFTLRIKDQNMAAAIARQIDAAFENSPAETKTEPEGAFVRGWAQQTGNVGYIVSAIVVAVFFTLLLVIGNTIAQAVGERTGELGVLKAIGFTRFQILGLIVAESCAITIAGGMLGLMIVVAVVAHGDPTGGLLPMFNLHGSDLAVGVGASALLGVITGALPGIQAMRLQAAHALRRL